LRYARTDSNPIDIRESDLNTNIADYASSLLQSKETLGTTEMAEGQMSGGA